MNSRFFSKSSRKFFGTSLFSMNPQNLRSKWNSANITKNINTSMRKISINNLIIADQINNYGCVNFNFSSLLNSNDELIKLENEEMLEIEQFKVSFF